MHKAHEGALLKLVYFALSIIVLAVILNSLRSVMMPFVAGMVLAYFLDPVADRLEKLKISRTVSVVIILSSLALLFLLVMAFAVPMLQGQIVSFMNNLPKYVASFQEKASCIIEFAKQHVASSKIDGLLDNATQYSGQIVKWVGKILGGLVSGSVAFFSILSLLVITPVVAFYMLRDWDKMVAKIDELIPRNEVKTIRKLLKEINTTIAGFLRGQSTVCIVLGLVYAIGLSVVGLEMGFVVGLISGLISFIPYVGCVTGFLVSMAIALAQFTTPAPIIAVAVVFAIGQFLEGNFLTPKLVGEKVGLHPVWVMFALLAGGVLLGFLGIMIAVPVAAVIGVLVRFAIGEYLKSEFYLGDDKPKLKKQKN